MEYYDYQDWAAWPEADVRGYAREIATDHSLIEGEADHLEQAMLWEANQFPNLPTHPERAGPKRMDASWDELARSLGHDEDWIFTANVSLNEPRNPPKDSFYKPSESRFSTVGTGLTRRTVETVVSESPFMRQERRKHRRRIGQRPFTTLLPSIDGLADHAMWRANCYQIAYGRWLIAKGQDEPRGGLVWYANELRRAHFNARTQARRGNVEAALKHAFDAGNLLTELELKLAHDATFMRYKAMNDAQRAAGESTARVSRTAKREAYHRHRAANQRASKTEAARRAGRELGVSASTIVRAFPSGLPD